MSFGLSMEDVGIMAVPVVLSILERKVSEEWQPWRVLARELKTQNKISKLTWIDVRDKLSTDFDARPGSGKLSARRQVAIGAGGIPLGAFHGVNPKVMEELNKADKDGNQVLDPEEIAHALEACLGPAQAMADATTAASCGLASREEGNCSRLSAAR